MEGLKTPMSEIWMLQPVLPDNSYVLKSLIFPCQGANRIVGAPSGPKAIGALQEGLLIDGFEHLPPGVQQLDLHKV